MFLLMARVKKGCKSIVFFGGLCFLLAELVAILSRFSTSISFQ